MEDRELLKLAAKAAGYEVEFDHNEIAHIHEGNGPQSWAIWNPLEDDGDALRLAVELCIPVWRDADVIWCNHIASVAGDDPHAATRRAIVRAAADLGSRSNA